MPDRPAADRPPARPEPVTVTIARRVAPGREADFEEFSAALTRAATRSPGFLGAGMLRSRRGRSSCTPRTSTG